MELMTFPRRSFVLKQWLLVLLLSIYLFLFFPLPESPFFLGGTLAVILWLVERALEEPV
jgi:hypothetical protein